MSRVVLTEDSIVETSIRLIEESGSDRFTLRRLGEALGADPTAIYRHFRTRTNCFGPSVTGSSP